MEFDSFLGSPRWEILKILSKKPSSPTDIAGSLGTTVAYVSQQLKVLDAAGLISRERTGASERGKPRSVFSLSKDLFYIAALVPGFSDKKLISGKNYRSEIVKLWLSEDDSIHYYLEKLYWKLEENRGEIDGFFIEPSSSKAFIVSDSKPLKSKIESYLSGFEKKFSCSFISPKHFKDEGLVCIYSKLNCPEGKNEK